MSLDLALPTKEISVHRPPGELRRAWLRAGLTTQMRLGLCAVFFTGWLLFGGAVLQALEQPGELQELSDLEDSIVMAKEHLGDALFAKIGATLSDFPHTGSLCSSWPIDTNASSWTLSKSTFFSLQLATSIGYGTQAPKTAGGKLFSIFYSVVGFCIWVSADIGQISPRMHVLTRHCNRATPTCSCPDLSKALCSRS
jgi:hypothetical protein